MACSSTDPLEVWIDHAERSLFALASELRRVPLDASTKGLHLRALELKREIARWRGRPPDPREPNAVLEEIERLAEETRRRPTRMARSRSLVPATCSPTSSVGIAPSRRQGEIDHASKAPTSSRSSRATEPAREGAREAACT